MLPKKRLKLKLLIILFFVLILFPLFMNLEVVKNSQEHQVDDMVAKAEYMKNNDSKGGTTYYISANGNSGNGTDINDPMSLKVAKTKKYKSNDKILLKRGDVFYDTLEFDVSVEENQYIYIGTYGDENLSKPIITTAYYVDKKEAWNKFDDNIYVLDMSKRNYLNGYVTYYSTSYNIGFLKDEQGNIYGFRKDSIEDLKNDFDFYCEDKYLYVKCKDNPINLLGKIIITSKHNIVTLNSNYILDGLIIQDTGAHGIVKNGEGSNIIILNCTIQNIGGSLFEDVYGNIERYGNGIEFWNQANNTLVQNCIFRNIYDAAYTLQGSGVTQGFDYNTCINNIFINCSYPVEMSCHNGDSIEDCSFEGNVVKNNLIINQGSGFGYDTRSNKYKPSNMVIAMLPVADSKLQYSNNRIYNSKSLYFKGGSALENLYEVSVDADNNIYYLKDDVIYCIDTEQHRDINYLYNQGLDQNSTFNYLSDTEIEEISNPDILNSNDYDEIKTYYDKFDVKYRNSHATENIIPTIESIINDEKYNGILQNNEISLAYEELKKAVSNLSQNIDIINVDSVSYSYECLYNFINTIKDKFLNNEINMQKDNFIELVSQLDSVSNEYKDIYSYYITEDNTSLDTIKNTLNNIIDKYNNNLDLDIGYLENIITTAKDLYNNSITTDNLSLNVLNKQRIINITNFANSIIDLKINEFVEEEKQKIKVEFDKDTTTPTNENITATLIVGDNTIIKNNGGSNKHIFEKNETFTYELEIKGVIFNVQVTISNINKDYTIEEEYITNIGGNTQILDFKDNLGISNFTFKRDDELVNINEDIVKTGDIITFNNKSYTLIVSGDINSDGGCTIKDIVSYRKYLLKYSEYSNIQFKAADINQDNELTIKDLVGIRELLLN